VGQVSKEPKYDASKAIRPGYRVQPGATNGPYHWGNGPKPEGKLSRLLKALVRKK
jgi:hypothetical protein